MASASVVRRYNYYISHGIDTEHIAPLDRSWIERVLALLAPRLRQDKDDLITCLTDEMREDYLLSVKKAIIDFVLRDPRSEIETMVWRRQTRVYDLKHISAMLI